MASRESGENALLSCRQLENPYPGGVRLFLIAFSVSLLVVLAGIEGAVLDFSIDINLTKILVTIVATMGPAIFKDLHNTTWHPAYLGTSFLLAAAVSAPLCAHLSDMFGRPTVILCSGLILAIGLGLCAIAPSILLLFVARGIAGLGGGGVNIMSSIILSGRCFVVTAF
jgi:MFS family permease